MGRLRRRRRKYTWLPLIGFQGDTNEDDTAVLPFTVPAVVANNNLSDVIILPIVPDAPNDTPTALSDHLDDFIGNEYFLKRIVGKCAISANTIIQSNDTTAFPKDIVVGVGFFVARADRTGTTTFGNPIGAGSATERKENYGPLTLQNTREPWIWRRTWLLSPRIASVTTGAQLAQTIAAGPIASGAYPATNYDGSVAEGTHIDAKTARRIGNDDRLWFACQTQCVNPTSNVGYNFGADGALDVRLLGALRRSKGRSSF